MNKAQLRRHFLALRKALPADEHKAGSHKICWSFFHQKWLDSAGVIHTFLPILHQNEVNTWPIIHRLWTDNPTVRTVISTTDTTTKRLSHQVITAATSLTENRWGTPEPATDETALVSANQLDLVLVPLLAFNHRGHRVGYGGGFYDRFLADCRPDCLKVGLSFAEPIDQIDDIEPTDIPLDACITPSSIIYF